MSKNTKRLFGSLWILLGGVCLVFGLFTISFVASRYADVTDFDGLKREAVYQIATAFCSASLVAIFAGIGNLLLHKWAHYLTIVLSFLVAIAGILLIGGIYALSGFSIAPIAVFILIVAILGIALAASTLIAFLRADGDDSR